MNEMLEKMQKELNCKGLKELSIKLENMSLKDMEKLLNSVFASNKSSKDVSEKEFMDGEKEAENAIRMYEMEDGVALSVKGSGGGLLYLLTNGIVHLIETTQTNMTTKGKLEIVDLMFSEVKKLIGGKNE